MRAECSGLTVVLLAAVAGLAACRPADAQPAPQTAATAKAAAFDMTSVGLYQPSIAYEERVGDVKPLSDYIAALREEARRTFEAASPGPGITGAIVVAVRPGNSSRVWLVTGENVLSPTVSESLRRRLEAVPAVTVKNGPIGFAMNFNAWGGGKPIPVPESYPIPVPQEWRDALTAGGGYLPDDALPKAWPETAPN